MGNLGFGEIIMIVVFALVVIGPNRLPQAGRQLGKALAEFRRVSSGVRQDLEDALDVSDLKDTVNEFRNVMDPRKLLADTIAPLNDDKPLSAPVDPETGVVRSAVPPPDGDVAHPVTSPLGHSAGVSVPAPSISPGRDILELDDSEQGL